MTLSFWKYKVYAILAGVRLSRCVKRHWGLSTTAIFGDLGGYVFENFKDTSSNIIMTICYPLSVGNLIAK